MKRKSTIWLVGLLFVGLLLPTLAACAPSPSDAATEADRPVEPEADQRRKPPAGKEKTPAQEVEATDPQSAGQKEHSE